MDKTLTFPAYPTYKDSGVDWLGEIPGHWELTRLGSYFEERKTKVSDTDFPPLSVTKNGILPQLDSAAKSNDGDNRKLVRKGDFVINSRSDRKGSSGIANEDGSVSLINIVLKPISIHPIFCTYLLKSNAFVEENYRIGHGIVADLWTTRYDEMKNIKIGIPPLSEQTAIAKFLDDKTAKIDRVVAQKEKMIALLKERKQIIIQQAVTKGLDPNAKMKDSGVEWIGEIPEGWEVKSIKSSFKLSNISGREGLPILTVSIHNAVSDNELADEDNLRGKIRIESKEEYKLVQPGDLVYNMMRAWQGGIGAVRTLGLVSPAYVVVSPIRKLDSQFFEFFTRTKLFINEMDKVSRGITDFRKRLYWNEFKNLSVLIPSIDEQKAIVEFIESQSAKIDKAIMLQEQQMEKLKELKATLIDAAVTGKIKVG